MKKAMAPKNADLPVELGRNMRKSRAPPLTRSRAIDRSLRRAAPVHGNRRKNGRRS